MISNEVIFLNMLASATGAILALIVIAVWELQIGLGERC